MCAAWRYDVCSMVAVADCPEVYIDGLGAVEIVGENMTSTLYRARIFNGVLERVPTLTLVRPLITLPETIEALQSMLQHMPVPKPEILLKRVAAH